MSLNKILVKPGQFVQQGQIIGLMGKTGKATGVHVHFAVKRSGKYIDPFIILNARGRKF